MRKITRAFLCAILSLCLLLSIFGCSFSGSIPGVEVQVTFIIDLTETSVSVPYGEVVSPLLNPKKENYIFSGWYTDEARKNEYDFSKPVTRDIELYAGFVLDGAALTNEITIDVMPALLTVENEYISASGNPTVAQGSGFIYKIENGRAYVLTNCHVAYADSGMQSFTVKDFQGREYTAAIYRKSLLSAPAISADYDLAVLTFLCGETDLKAIPFAKAEAESGDGVISLGSPGNQSHAITFGEMIGLRSVNLPESNPNESNVTFDIIYHSAAITNGSSGGPLLDGDLELKVLDETANEGSDYGLAIFDSANQEFLDMFNAGLANIKENGKYDEIIAKYLG